MSQKEIHNYKCTLTPEVLDKAIRELNEDPETRHIEIQILRERLERYPGLHAQLDDVFLMKFLRARKFDQERTFELILKHYQVKKENEDIFAEMVPSCCRMLLETGISCMLPHRTKNGEAIIITRAGHWDPAVFPVEEILKSGLMVWTTLLEVEQTQVSGVVLINDLTGLHWGHVKTFTPSQSKKMITVYQDAFPVRIKGIHYVHEPSLFDTIFAMLKPFLKDKLIKRLHFHGENIADLQKYIDPEHLPQDYGGKLPALSTEYTLDLLRKRQLKFEEETKFGFVDMKIKQQTHKSPDALENMSGTFKKLNVD